MAKAIPNRMIRHCRDDQISFIGKHTRLLPVPHALEIRLHLADDSTDLWSKTEEELGEIGLPPPFWAFAWAGGQALARYVLDHPGIVKGKRVLDLASGSGLVGIAASMAGALSVEAIDIDDFAIAAIGLNAAANNVPVRPRQEDVTKTSDQGTAVQWDVILAGDVSYDREMSAGVTNWLAALHRQGLCVLIGDPGRAYLDRDRLAPVARYQIKVMRDLEDSEVKDTSVWQFTAAPEQTAPIPD